ncbi:interaptin [Amyelois transitella]|uniref:interaptin n=1 Tax=Amyelois transitella TaxID=680683 RepID=UPI00299046AF|nr:interaptin [Amyelois transitella]
MFSKAKRFEMQVPIKPPCTKEVKKLENEKQKATKTPLPLQKTHRHLTSSKAADTLSQCSSVPSVRSLATPRAPRPLKPPVITSSTKKALCSATKTCNKMKDEKTQAEIIKSQEVEIRNKDHTITEHNKQIEELKNEIASLQKQMQETLTQKKEFEELHKQFSQITLTGITKLNDDQNNVNNNKTDDMKSKIFELELQCDRLEQEVSNKQLELSSLEEVIAIRDSLCQDLQAKLTTVERNLEETRQRLEMVKGHHALALEANESIRREYKVELEALKTKLEEEKQIIMNKSKVEEDNMKSKYNELIDSIKSQLIKERDETVSELKHEIEVKEIEMKAKLEQINESTHEKLRICEIQFEERSRSMQEHCEKLQNKAKYLEQEEKELKYSLALAEEQNMTLQREFKKLQNDNELLRNEKNAMSKEIEDLKEDSKKKLIDYENEINKLTVEIDKSTKEKTKFQMSLNVTMDIVQVLTRRLRDSDNELELLEDKVKVLTNSKEQLENELESYKSTLNNTLMECNEFKEALVAILKSKAALAKEHNRIMEHNVTLIESLQVVEKEAYRELGSIKNELIEDVELIKKESQSQIQMLREEVEKKRVLCELATEQAGAAARAGEQARALLARAAADVARLEADCQRYQLQMEDQQSLVVELSLLRQENEELSMTVAKQSSLIDKMTKEAEQIQTIPKSPSVAKKSLKIGKENLQNVISPLRERNH